MTETGTIAEWTGAPVYKFIEPKTLGRVVKSGSLRIGTFLSYSRLEDDRRRDSAEGTAYTQVDRLVMSEELGFPLPHFHMVGEGKIVINDCEFISRVPNLYCFCVSSTLDAAPKTRHAAFRIRDLKGLASALTRQNPRLGPVGVLGHVKYQPRRGKFHESGYLSGDPFIKDEIYKDDAEVRCVWTRPLRKPLPPRPLEATEEGLAGWRELSEQQGVSAFNTVPSAEIAQYLHRLY